MSAYTQAQTEANRQAIEQNRQQQLNAQEQRLGLPVTGSSSSGSGSSGSGQDYQGGMLGRLEGQAQEAATQAASQDIADEYNDAGFAADLASGQDTGGTPLTQPSSLSRLGDASNWRGMTGHLTGVQGAQLDALPAEGGNQVWVTVPVDKVVLNQQGSAVARPTYATGTGYKPTPSGVPSPQRTTPLPGVPPSSGAHPTQGGM